MTILITGSSGYIGKYLVNKFSNESNTVLKYDLPKDIRNLPALERVFEGNQIDLVIHCAAQKYIDRAERCPLSTFDTNITGTYNIFYLCDKYNVGTCIFFSTDKAVDPVNIYGITKHCAEQLLQYFAKKSATRFITLRLCNIYGSTGSVIPIFKAAIQKDEPLKIVDPRMRRYFITLDQVYEIVDAAIKYAKSGDILLYNIKKPTLILDLAKALCKKYNKEFKYEIVGNTYNEKLIETYSLKGCKRLAGNVYYKNDRR